MASTLTETFTVCYRVQERCGNEPWDWVQREYQDMDTEDFVFPPHEWPTRDEAERWIVEMDEHVGALREHFRNQGTDLAVGFDPIPIWDYRVVEVRRTEKFWVLGEG